MTPHPLDQVMKMPTPMDQNPKAHSTLAIQIDP
jgi:hypothetical protein